MFNFSVRLRTALGRELIAPFSMAVNRGDKIAVIGEEGNGKSSLLKALAGHSDVEDLELDLQIMPQGIIFSYLEQEISEENLAKSCLFYLLGQDWESYPHLLKLWREYLPHCLEEDLDRPLASFSGGEQVKIQLIGLILREADCFLLDEPTNNLDLETLLWLEAWILKQEKPVLFVSHDLALLEKISTKVIHLEQTHRKTRSRVKQFIGNYRDYVTARQKEISGQNQNAENQKRMREKQEERWRRLYQQVNHQLKSTNSRNPNKGRLLKKKMKSVKAMRSRIDKEEVLRKQDVEESINLFFNQEKGYHKKLFDFHLDELRIGDRLLSSDLSLSLHSDEKLVIMGPNGCGKTSYLKAVLKYLDTQKLSYEVMYQDYSLGLDYDKNALDNLLEDSKKESLTQVRLHLGALKFTEEEMMAKTGSLSGGQRAKLLLLRCVLKSPDLLILDEPTRNLSPLSVEVIYDLFKDYPGAILCVSHDRRFIDEVFDRGLYFSEAGFIDFELD